MKNWISKRKIKKITNWASRYYSLDNDLVKQINKSQCTCDWCGDHIKDLDDFPSIRESSLICEYCEREHFYFTCHLCEDSEENTEGPENYYFAIVGEDAAKATGLVEGIHHALSFPLFMGNI